MLLEYNVKSVNLTTVITEHGCHESKLQTQRRDVETASPTCLGVHIAITVHTLLQRDVGVISTLSYIQSMLRVSFADSHRTLKF